MRDLISIGQFAQITRLTIKALHSLVSLLGPLWAGAVYDSVMPGAPYWMGAGVYGLAALMLINAIIL